MCMFENARTNRKRKYPFLGLCVEPRCVGGLLRYSVTRSIRDVTLALFDNKGMVSTIDITKQRVTIMKRASQATLPGLH